MAVTKKIRKSNKIVLNSKDDPKLIKAVVRELRTQDAKLILSKLQDLEKAIYHIAGKQQDMLEFQKQLEKVVVSTATSLEEMINGFDVTVSPEEPNEEENFLIDAWATPKKPTSPVSN
jgi:predicted glycosyltransferase